MIRIKLSDFYRCALLVAKFSFGNYSSETLQHVFVRSVQVMTTGPSKALNSSGIILSLNTLL